MRGVARMMFLAACLAGALAAQRVPERRDLRELGLPEIVPPEVLKGRDALQADPKHYRLDKDNEHMRVLRLSLKSDEVVPMHDDKDALFVCLKECHLRLTRPDGKMQDIHLMAGESRWVYGDTRSEKNLSNQALEMVVIEPK